MSSSSLLGARAPAVAADRRRSRRALARFARHRLAVVGAGFLLVVLLVAIFDPAVAPYHFSRQDLLDTYAGPDARHVIGTDALGRDMLSRLMYGARVSMSVGVVSTAVVLAIGVPLGLVAGYFGGTFDLLKTSIDEPALEGKTFICHRPDDRLEVYVDETIPPPAEWFLTYHRLPHRHVRADYDRNWAASYGGSGP